VSISRRNFLKRVSLISLLFGLNPITVLNAKKSWCEENQKKRVIWIMRHGIRQDNVDPNWRKTAKKPDDPPLAKEGRLQAIDTGKFLSNQDLQLIYSSPFLRCIQTAGLIANIIKVPIRVEYGLCEALFARWFSRMPDLLSVTELKKEVEWVDETYKSVVIPLYPENEEKDTWERCARTMQRILTDTTGNILLVGHGASVAGMVKALTGTIENGNYNLCGLNKIEATGTGWILRWSGDDHLSIRGDRIRANNQVK
jgi:broad specificity phosphatase PhoE